MLAADDNCHHHKLCPTFVTNIVVAQASSIGLFMNRFAREIRRESLVHY